MEEVTVKKYNIVYADPPWRYDDSTCWGAAEKHYHTMSLRNLCELPIKYITADNSILFLWATYPKLEEALEVITAWGFKYKSIAFQWVKTCPRQTSKFFYGLGRWTRGNTEPCLLATKGKPQRISNKVFQLVLSPVERHSQKPACIRDKIIELMGDLPRVELFARQKCDGWDSWGDEVDSDLTLIK